MLKLVFLVFWRSQAEILEPYLTQRLAKDGKVIDVSLTSTALLNEARDNSSASPRNRAFPIRW